VDILDNIGLGMNKILPYVVLIDVEQTRSSLVRKIEHSLDEG